MTSEEDRAIFIGEKLGIVTNGKVWFYGKTYLINDMCKEYSPREVIEWLSSPEGIHAIKQKMIERGYNFNQIMYFREVALWSCAFLNEKTPIYTHEFGKEEAEAILDAAEKALRREDAR